VRQHAELQSSGGAQHGRGLPAALGDPLPRRRLPLRSRLGARARPARQSAGETFYTDREVSWFGPAGNAPDWQGSDNRLGCLIRDSDTALCLLFNAAPDRCQFIMPAPPGSSWQVVIDTSKEDPTADTSPGTEPGVNAADEIWLEAGSTIVAICRSMEA
jgi:hypothetical protein